MPVKITYKATGSYNLDDKVIKEILDIEDMPEQLSKEQLEMIKESESDDGWEVPINAISDGDVELETLIQQV